MTGAETLSLVTFGELAQSITAKRDAAREGTTKVGWQQLLDIVEVLAGQSAEHDLVTGRTWRLHTVRAKGYQGVSDELVVDLDPSPGITVIHGPNGSGKSSVADAVDTALRGSPRPATSTGAGGNLPLWERQHHHRDATLVSVEVVLCDGEDQLALVCHLDGSGRVTGRVATLRSAGQDSAVDLSDGWTSALLGYQPVFGYAHIERQVQVAKDLQAFLEPLLAFGGCFTALSAALAEATAPSEGASSRWKSALASAKSRVAEVDRERASGDAPALPDLAWPAPSDDIDTWLSTAGLVETGAASPEVTSKRLDRTRRQAEAVEEAVRQLSAAEASLHARLAVPLQALEREARHRGEAGDVCPVCDTGDVPWLERLTTNLAGITDVKERLGAARSAISALASGCRTDLLALVEGMSAVDLRSDLVTAAERVEAARAAYVSAVDHDGTEPSADVRVRADELRTVLDDDLTARAVDEAARLTAHERQWRLARRTGVEPLLSVWRRDGAAAAEEPTWKAAASNLRTLQNELRRQRAEVLRSTTARAVEQLLDDVGVEISGLTVSQREAGMQIKDVTGKDVSLSMLSAGQRNALLLAPLLAVRVGGPFGFLVLDDPVHAFDAVRVDRLAAILGRLAKDRRVVVLTHDERLREHLLVQSAVPDLRTIRRTATGAVIVETAEPVWRMLLADAQRALTLSEGLGGVGRTDVVRGLCRMAVDDAIRVCVHRTALSTSADVSATLAQLDRENTTKDRLKFVVSAFSTQDAASRATTTLEQLKPYLQGWNRSSHGNAAESDADEHEVAAATTACSHLVGPA